MSFHRFRCGFIAPGKALKTGSSLPFLSCRKPSVLRVTQQKQLTSSSPHLHPRVTAGNQVQVVSRNDLFDPTSYALREHYQHELDNAALDGIHFNKEPREGHQYLDIGCGTGGFTRSVLLPLSRPCRRLVATDVSQSMLEFARRQNIHDDIVYDQLDISSDEEVSTFAEKYGRFGRIYSLLCFHFVPDDKVAFRNVARLLSAGGQCLVSAGVYNPAVDAWADVYKMPQWNSLLPDPAVVFPSGERFNRLGTATRIEQDMRRRVTDAGLKCLTCDVKFVPWHFQDIGQACDKHLEEFKISVGVPINVRDSLKRDYTECLRHKVKETPSGCELTLRICRVLAKLS